MSGIDASFHLNWPGFSLEVSAQLPGRGLTALFGSSGSGKTTLLRCIAGLERAAQGRLVVNNEVWQGPTQWLPTHQRPIGYVFQEASLFEHLSVWGNLRYGPKRLRTAQQIDLEQAIELLGIEPLLKRKPAHLSGGERQRVAIARALSVNPQLLLMDEPLAALDNARKQEILPYLERLRDELAIPILYVTHSHAELTRLADHIVWLEAGKVRASGPLAETLTRLDLPHVMSDDICAVFHTTVTGLDPAWHLAHLTFEGGQLWTQDHGLSVGQELRVSISARDVSLATQPGTSSIQNVLQGEVDAITPAAQPSLAVVRLRIGPTLLWAQVTRRALVDLRIETGQHLWVQVKSVALST